MPTTTAPLQRRPRLWRHPATSSPDPSLDQELRDLGGNRFGLELHPHALLRSVPADAATAAWAERLHLHRHPGSLVLALVESYAELLLDLGSEVEGWPVLELESEAPVSVVADFGESVEEAEGLVLGLTPLPTVSRAVPAGRQRLTFDLARYRQEGSGGVFGPAEALPGDDRPSWMGGRVQRAARFVRLRFVSSAASIVMHGFSMLAEFTGRQPAGGFTCSDPRWQHLWWTSLYTARLCTRPEAFWDGPKRDRNGWYGDARIIQLAWLGGWCDPRPAQGLLARIPVGSWPGGVPGYSADALAMVREQFLVHGDSDGLRSAYARALDMIGWIAGTQCDQDGLLRRQDGVKLFGGIGFTDWSELPQGGRLEELACPQCKLLELWRLAAEVAGLLGDQVRSADWRGRAEALTIRLRERFWRPGIGMIHTLNHVGEVPNPLLPAVEHARRSYDQGIALGASGPSRQANALAVLAGVVEERDLPLALSVLDSAALPPVITPYFHWFLAEARARCGSIAAALRAFADYVGGHLEAEQAATIWELYDPRVRDLRRFSGHLEQGHEWQLSLCHGWGAGFVPLVARHLAGISITAPGYRSVRCAPNPEPGPAFALVIPTPLGPLAVEGDGRGKHLCRAPAGMAVAGGATVEVGVLP